jgi:hypothetical protein
MLKKARGVSFDEGNLLERMKKIVTFAYSIVHQLN